MAAVISASPKAVMMASMLRLEVLVDGWRYKEHQACVNTVFVHKLKQEGIEIALLVSHWLIFFTNQQTKVLAPNYNPK